MFQKYRAFFVQDCLTRNEFLKKYIKDFGEYSTKEIKDKIQKNNM